MALYCIGSYLVVAMFFFLLIWRALALAKNDDINRGLDFSE